MGSIFPLTSPLDNGALQAEPKNVITEGFIYEPETATFIRTKSASVPTADASSANSDLVFMQYVGALSFGQKESIARTTTIDGAAYVEVQKFADGAVGYEDAAPRRNLSAAVTDIGSPGNLLPGKGNWTSLM